MPYFVQVIRRIAVHAQKVGDGTIKLDTGPFAAVEAAQAFGTSKSRHVLL